MVGVIVLWFYILNNPNSKTTNNNSSSSKESANVAKNITDNNTISSDNTTSIEDLRKITVIDFKNMSKSEVENWCKQNNVMCSIYEEYSNKIEKGKLISQGIEPNYVISEEDNITFIYSLGKKPKVTVPDFSKMTKKESQKWGKENNVDIDIKEDYSSKVKNGKLIKQNIKAKEQIEIDEEITLTYSLGRKATIEDLNALEKAKSYSTLMHMSKKGIYEQLISSYGENFDKEAAQYAIDNLDENWNYNALQKAKDYRSTMHMSKKAIYQQLISKYGEQFTKSEAQYAIDHLDD